MTGEEVLSDVINGFFQRHQIDKWARLILSCAGSAFCPPASVWGAGTLAHLASGQALLVALAFGFAESMIATTGVVWNVWHRSPLAKNTPIAESRSGEEAETKILAMCQILNQFNTIFPETNLRMHSDIIQDSK